VANIEYRILREERKDGISNSGAEYHGDSFSIDIELLRSNQTDCWNLESEIWNLKSGI
jgi:hypothetical protein